MVETEACAGPEDRASHAFGNRRTARTEVMFRAGGVAYAHEDAQRPWRFRIRHNPWTSRAA